MVQSLIYNVETQVEYMCCTRLTNTVHISSVAVVTGHGSLLNASALHSVCLSCNSSVITHLCMRKDAMWVIP